MGQGGINPCGLLEVQTMVTLIFYVAARSSGGISNSSLSHLNLLRDGVEVSPVEV